MFLENPRFCSIHTNYESCRVLDKEMILQLENHITEIFSHLICDLFCGQLLSSHTSLEFSNCLVSCYRNSLESVSEQCKFTNDFVEEKTGELASGKVSYFTTDHIEFFSISLDYQPLGLPLAIFPP